MTASRSNIPRTFHSVPSDTSFALSTNSSGFASDCLNITLTSIPAALSHAVYDISHHVYRPDEVPASDVEAMRVYRVDDTPPPSLAFSDTSAFPDIHAPEYYAVISGTAPITDRPPTTATIPNSGNQGHCLIHLTPHDPGLSIDPVDDAGIAICGHDWPDDSNYVEGGLVSNASLPGDSL